ncbi:MAG: glutathione S-transferase family protein [Myxococcales bacterium]|nr:glutathione S-transferase family protein [Myxococcales bacterium]
MKLLNSPLSPFAARVRLAIHDRSLPVEVVPSNMWTPERVKNPEFLAINPIGKVPTLVLDDGTALPESDTIVEYLADAFPQARLRPEEPRLAARGRLLARICELYVMTPAFSGMFMQLFAASRDEAAIDAALARVVEGVGHLEHFMTDDAFAAGDRLTTADCTLVPSLYFLGLIVGALGRDDPALARRRVAGYLERVQRVDSVQRVLGEMRAGLVGSRLAMLLPA